MSEDHIYFGQMALPPWCESAWRVLQSRREYQTVPHALLLVGTSGLGKRLFAETLAHSLLCQKVQKDGSACNQCYACEVKAAGAHPDFLLITPEEEGKQVKIDQVRDIGRFAQQSVSISPYKVALIDPAEALNVHAANALLKTLEEPTKNTVLILVNHDLSLLPATIKSRCQIIRFTQPSVPDASQWLMSESDKPYSPQEMALALSLAQGAPFRALEFLQDDELEFRKKLMEILNTVPKNPSAIPTFASQWSKENLERMAIHWRSWITDMIYIQFDLDDSRLTNQDIIPILKTLAKTAQPKKLYDFLETLNKNVLLIKKGLNLNMQLTLESLLFHWFSMVEARKNEL